MTIDGVPVTFDQAKFDQLATEKGARWGKSSLTALRSLLTRRTPPVQRQEVLYALEHLPADKKAKYKDVIKYVVFYYPDLILPGELNPVVNGRRPGRKNFQEMFATMNQNTDFVDLIYGVAAARVLQPYKLNGGGRLRQADDFNNAAAIGNGVAFKRNWNSTGFLDATPSSVNQAVLAAAARPGEVEGIREDTRQVHAQALLNSRYNPAIAFLKTTDSLAKDTQLPMSTWNRQRDAQEHYWMHARFIKAIRMACKGGIAMLASAPQYTAIQAKIHFVLDKLGDLGKIARKDPLPNKEKYVAITTSELCFCMRYWSDPRYPLSRVVKFYVNGEMVFAPWEADWTLNDVYGNGVYSNQEAWKRYSLRRDIVHPEQKAFPRNGDEDDDDRVDD